MEYVGLGLSAILFIMAAICNALMDTLQFHWYKFRWKDDVNDEFWNPAISWRNKYIDGDKNKGFKYKGWLGFMSNFLDAWHLFKMIMILCFAFSVLFFPISFKFCIFNDSILNGALWLCILGVCWNFPFNYCYNHFFVKKEVKL